MAQLMLVLAITQTINVCLISEQFFIPIIEELQTNEKIYQNIISGDFRCVCHDCSQCVDRDVQRS